MVIETDTGGKKVVALPPRPPAPADRAPPAANVIEVLEDLLRSAHAGELRSIAFAGVRDGRTGKDRITRGWARDPASAEFHTLAAAIGDLSFGYFHERYNFFDDPE